MANLSQLEVLLSDPLSKTARQERNKLLVTSLIGLAVAKAHILPTKISSLGVDFSGSNQRAFVVLLALVVLYFLLAFAIYGSMDVLLAQATARKALFEQRVRAEEEMQRSLRQFREESIRRPNSQYDPPRAHRVVARPLFVFRAIIFDFLLPCVLGLMSIVLLFRTH